MTSDTPAKIFEGKILSTLIPLAIAAKVNFYLKLISERFRFDWSPYRRMLAQERDFFVLIS